MNGMRYSLAMNAPTVLQANGQKYRRDAPRVFAKLVRLLGDFDLTEEGSLDASEAKCLLETGDLVSTMPDLRA